MKTTITVHPTALASDERLIDAASKVTFKEIFVEQVRQSILDKIDTRMEEINEVILRARADATNKPSLQEKFDALKAIGELEKHRSNMRYCYFELQDIVNDACDKQIGETR